MQCWGASAFAALAVGVACLARSAAPAGPEPPPIRLGMSTALSGLSFELGLQVRDGVQAAIDEVNRKGGLNGRKVELIALDDGYEPERTAPNMRGLTERDQVLAVVCNIGTPTAVAALPIALENRTPFYGAFTGAGILRRNPPDRYVINFRASYAEEIAAMVDALIAQSGLRPEEIGFFTQRDAYGDAGFEGGLEALRRYGVTDARKVVHGRYERNTLAVENALADLMLAPTPVRAVIMVAAYAPAAQFVRLAHEHELDPVFLAVSVVGSTPLARALGEAGDGVIITQVVPHLESDVSVVARYRAAMQASRRESLSFGSLEAYIAADILFTALERHQGPLDREAVVEALEALGTFDIGLGCALHLSPQDHQASHCVWPTILRQGRVEPFDWSDLPRLLKREPAP